MSVERARERLKGERRFTDALFVRQLCTDIENACEKAPELGGFLAEHARVCAEKGRILMEIEIEVEKREIEAKAGKGR